MKVTAKTRRILKRVIRHIDEEPLRLDMGTWGTQTVPDEYSPSCGIVGCIAGWIVADEVTRECGKKALQLIRFSWDKTPLQAVRLLGISRYEADRLFIPDKWPLHLLMRLNKASQQAQRAKYRNAAVYRRAKRAEADVTIARIELFLETRE